MIDSVFAVFAVCALVLFLFVSPRRAVAITCMGGWLLLPFGNFPEGSADSSAPYWIIGAILPTDMLLTKLWVAPTVALAGALIADRKSFLCGRLQWLDLPIILWCAWPLLQSTVVESADPPGWIASLYVTAAWGIPWLLGRIYYSSRDGATELAVAIVAGLIVITPIALLETFVGPVLYGWLYEPHPFRFDGVIRYVGFRPLGFFEDGNQYSIWIAATAVVAVWLWTSALDTTRIRKAITAALAVALSLLSQSLGAIVLMIAGLVSMWVLTRSMFRWILPLAFALIVLSIGIYLTAAGPLRTMAEATSVGRKVVDVVRATGRGSILWRFARDQQAVALIREHPIVGTSHWDWWRPNQARPWNLSFLIVGQFGLVGLFLAFGTLLIPIFYALRTRWRSPISLQDPAVPLLIVVAMAVGDAQFNSFFFYPALLAVGALVPARQDIAFRPGGHNSPSPTPERDAVPAVPGNKARKPS